MCTLLLQFKTFPGIRVADPGDAEPDPDNEKKNTGSGSNSKKADRIGPIIIYFQNKINYYWDITIITEY